MRAIILIVILALVIPLCVSALPDNGTATAASAQKTMQVPTTGVRERTDVQPAVAAPTMRDAPGVPMGPAMMDSMNGQGTLTTNYPVMMGGNGYGMMGWNNSGTASGNGYGMMGGSGMGCPMMDSGSGMMGGGCPMMGGSGYGMMGGSGYGMMGGSGMGWGTGYGGTAEPWFGGLAFLLPLLMFMLVSIMIIVWIGAGIMLILYLAKKMPKS